MAALTTQPVVPAEVTEYVMAPLPMVVAEAGEAVVDVT